MVIVHFIRHAQTTANAGHVIAGASDVPLSETGIRQAESLRGRLRPDSYTSVTASDLSRTQHTARLAGFDRFAIDARVRELDFGELEGVPWRDALQQHAGSLGDFMQFAAPGGESVAQLQGRVASFLDELHSGTHAVFCHGGVIRVALAMLGEHRFVGNCSIVHVDWTERAFLNEFALDAAE